MAWLRNGQELDVAIMHRSLTHLGFRIVNWDRYESAQGYTLRLESNKSITQMMPALTAWILKDWMWPGKHTIFASCASPGSPWHYLTYTLEVVKSPNESAQFTINEKID